jgi:hypothetical protein
MMEKFEGRLSTCQVFETLTSIPAISYRHMRSSPYTHTPDAAPGNSSGNAHAICDVGRQLAALITEVRDKLEKPIAASTIEEIRLNAEKVGLKGETAGYLAAEEPLDEVSSALYG